MATAGWIREIATPSATGGDGDGEDELWRAVAAEDKMIVEQKRMELGRRIDHALIHVSGEPPRGHCRAAALSSREEEVLEGTEQVDR